MPSRPYSGSSFSKLTRRISPACAWPPWTARLISGALNSDALEWTWILSLPPLALSTSLANCWMFSVWKLLAGYAVGRSHLVCAAAGRATARLNATATMRFMDSPGGEAIDIYHKTPGGRAAGGVR